MFRITTSAQILILSLCSVVLGQSPGQPPPGPPPGAPPSDRTVPRRPLARGINPMDPTALLDVMVEELKLDDAQRAAAQTLLADHRTALMEMRKSLVPPPETADQTREIMKKMREAQSAGNRELVLQYTDELRKLREETNTKLAPMREKMAKAQSDLHDKLVALLRDDQKQDFERIWEQRMVRGGGRSAMNDPRLLRMLVNRLPDITAEQKQKLQDLYKQHVQAQQEAKGEVAARQRADTAFHDAVMALLTPSQREEITRQLTGRDRRRPPEGAPGRPASPAPPGEGPQ